MRFLARTEVSSNLVTNLTSKGYQKYANTIQTSTQFFQVYLSCLRSFRCISCKSCLTTKALIEWQLGKDSQVARNIFDWGMNKYGTEPGTMSQIVLNVPAFVLEYLKFLSYLNDEKSIQIETFFHFS